MAQTRRAMAHAGAHADTASFMPAGATLAELRVAVQDCRGCELYRGATQAVLR